MNYPQEYLSVLQIAQKFVDIGDRKILLQEKEAGETQTPANDQKHQPNRKVLTKWILR